MAYGAAGAAIGAMVRWLVSVVWPLTVQEYAATLVIAAAAAGVLGFLRRGARESGPALMLWSAAGTAASLGLAAMFGVAQQPLWFAVYLVLFPLCVVIGFGTGLVLGSVVRHTAGPAQQAEQ